MTAGTPIATGLARIGMALRAQAWRQTGTSGLTPTQAQILAWLLVRGPARVGAVAEAMAITQPTASDAVKALIRKDQVEKRPAPADARAARLHPTPAGEAVAGRTAAPPDVLLQAIATLDPAEQGAFLKGLVKLIRALQEQGAIPLQRMCVTCSHFHPNVHADAARPHHCAFVDAAFGDAALRLDCGDHVAADPLARHERWRRFMGAPAFRGGVPAAATTETPGCQLS